MEARGVQVAVASDEAGTITLVVSGDLDIATAPELARSTSLAIDSGATKIVIDCGDLQFIDSSGINVLLMAWNEMKGRATMPLIVTNLQPNVRKVLDATGVTGLITE
ncbi:MAG TPA: STAS domain-containing protein [Aquihabitans sp.]|nr:STAS domain-containing protein [Aquihabitans sp.]